MPSVVELTPCVAPRATVAAAPAPLPVVLGLDRRSCAAGRTGFCRPTASALLLLLALAACTHRVQVEAPKEPIVINLNVKIEQEVRVKVEQDVEDLLEENPDIF